jgi:hypothetical protein
LTLAEHELIAVAGSGTSFEGAELRVARQLAQRNLLSPVDHTDPLHARTFAARSAAPPTMIWLPNALVSGAANETPPVERIRETRNAALFRLFGDLYDAQNLAEDGGIGRGIWYQPFERQPLGSCGQYDLWAFDRSANTYINPHPVFAPHVASFKDKGWGQPVWPLLHTLEDLGLIEWLHYVYDADPGSDREAEPRFPIGTGVDDALPNGVKRAIWAAASALGARIGREDALYEHAHVVPMQRHLKQVAMRAIPRMRYRARTRLTSAWWAKYSAACDECIQEYGKIAEAYGAAVAGNLQSA